MRTDIAAIGRLLRFRKVDIANTMTVHEFNQAGKLRHLDVYLQYEM